MERLIIVIIFTATIHMVDTLSYSVRLAGIRTKRLAMAISLFNIIVLISRTANMIQAPLLGSIVDKAINQGSSAFLLHDFRWIIASATLGSMLGAALIPSFVVIFSKGIINLEKAGSIPQLMGMVIFQQPIAKIKKSLVKPGLSLLKGLKPEKIPPTFLVLNLIITSISTIGVLAAIYAGALVPPLPHNCKSAFGNHKRCGNHTSGGSGGSPGGYHNGPNPAGIAGKSGGQHHGGISGGWENIGDPSQPDNIFMGCRNGSIYNEDNSVKKEAGFSHFLFLKVTSRTTLRRWWKLPCL
ncbi:lipid II flippase family protein [Biomaibacter acetigenes]|uniref:lipid II flippase family protein n=1 Tax=Biomaibacter acetigenes TaxID=2316383 RepID=UPI002482E8A5|nr:DUF2837 family protein [Biomaibacter acetigenes]